jgi:hypothetical protein
VQATLGLWELGLHAIPCLGNGYGKHANQDISHVLYDFPTSGYSMSLNEYENNYDGKVDKGKQGQISRVKSVA